MGNTVHGIRRRWHYDDTHRMAEFRRMEWRFWNNLTDWLYSFLRNWKLCFKHRRICDSHRYLNSGEFPFRLLFSQYLFQIPCIQFCKCHNLQVLQHLELRFGLWKEKIQIHVRFLLAAVIIQDIGLPSVLSRYLLLPKKLASQRHCHQRYLNKTQRKNQC